MTAPYTDTTTNIKPVTVYPNLAGGYVVSISGRVEVERTDDDEVRVEVYTRSQTDDGDDYETCFYLSLERASLLMAALGKAILA